MYFFSIKKSVYILCFVFFYFGVTFHQQKFKQTPVITLCRFEKVNFFKIPKEIKSESIQLHR